MSFDVLPCKSVSRMMPPPHASAPCCRARPPRDAMSRARVQNEPVRRHDAVTRRPRRKCPYARRTNVKHVDIRIYARWDGACRRERARATRYDAPRQYVAEAAQHMRTRHTRRARAATRRTRVMRARQACYANTAVCAASQQERCYVTRCYMPRVICRAARPLRCVRPIAARYSAMVIRAMSHSSLNSGNSW